MTLTLTFKVKLADKLAKYLFLTFKLTYLELCPKLHLKVQRSPYLSRMCLKTSDLDLDRRCKFYLTLFIYNIYFYFLVDIKHCHVEILSEIILPLPCLLQLIELRSCDWKLDHSQSDYYKRTYDEIQVCIL